MYNPSGNFPRRIQGYSLDVLSQNHLVIYGGNTREKILNNLYIVHLDMFKHEYSIKQQPFQHDGHGEIQEHSSVMIDGNLMVFGGSNNQSLLE